MTDKEKLEIALNMLALWCAMVDNNGTSWDDWDEAYKGCYRPGPLTEDIQARKKELDRYWNDDEYE